jgi:hypothetical protein
MWADVRVYTERQAHVTVASQCLRHFWGKAGSFQAGYEKVSVAVEVSV